MKKLVQSQVTLLFADVDEDGEIGETGQPVQLNISGREWKQKWATPHSREVFDNVLAQLAAQTNGQLPEPIPVNRAERRQSTRKATKK